MKFEHRLCESMEEKVVRSEIFNRKESGRVQIDNEAFEDESDNEYTCIPESDEGRLSRLLQTWMIDHEWRNIKPFEKPPLEPVFTQNLDISKYNARHKALHKENISKTSEVSLKSTNAEHIKSDDSIVTNLSLLSCSTEETIHKDTSQPKTKVPSSSLQLSKEVTSKWIEFANTKGSFLKRLLRSHAAKGHEMGFLTREIYSDESEAFRMMAQDEQKALFESGMQKGIKYINKQKLKRSSSVHEQQDTDIPPRRKTMRVFSASATKPWGKPLDINKIRRDRLYDMVINEQAKLLPEKDKHKTGRRFARGSSVNNSSASVGEMTPTVTTSLIIPKTGTNNMSVYSSTYSGSDIPLSSTSETTSDNEQLKEEHVAVWKGDREILEIDLKRELTQRVKEKIASTRAALKRVTGVGDDNEQVVTVGTLEEFPKHTEEDFCHKPRIVQKMRISPHLSDVIHGDIQIRMGRPRYHEIRLSDIEQWDKGQKLDRAHRNLKVFNWLHSLRGVNFKVALIPEINHELTNNDTSIDIELLHVEAADEPDAKPLYRAYEVRIL